MRISNIRILNLIFHLILLLIFVEGNAQSLKIKVIDSETNKALPYANIVVKSSSFGTVSNSEGYFDLSISQKDLEDSILVSYIGFKTYKNRISNLIEQNVIGLKQDNIGLKEISVYSRDLEAKEIIEKAASNFQFNHPAPQQKQRVFIHNFTHTPYSKKNKLLIKKSNFQGLDRSLSEEIESIMPDQFTDYSDAIVDLYSYDDRSKLKPVQAISLEENDQSQILDVLEDKLSVIFEDFQNAIKTKDIYYQFKTGILGTKIGDEDPEKYDDDESKEFQDSSIYPIPTRSIRSEINYLINNYSNIESEDLEFLSKTGKYRYELKGISFLNSEPVFLIRFEPKSGGLYKGMAYISNVNFAILQLEYEYASGKKSKNFQILGFGHAIKMKRARVIYEEFQNAYYPKYLKVYTREYSSFERNFSILKKRKRFLIDEVKNKAKLRAEIFVDVNSNWEVLIMERKQISENAFEAIEEDRYINFKKEISYSDDLWKDKTIIRPDSSLRSYQRLNN